MNWAWLILSAIGLLVLGLSVHGARQPAISPTEARVFHAINRLPDWLYAPLWLPMQLGNLVVGTVAGLVVALVQRDWVVAVGVVAAMLLKLIGERVIRREMAAYLEVRQRPGTSQAGAILRGDVPKSGASFPSGHVILVAAIGCIVLPTLGVDWWSIPGLLALAVIVGRIYVGAHNPLDVTAGFGAGLLLGGVVALFVS